MALADPKDFSRYDGFSIHTTSYKTVAGHAIEAAVLIPKHTTESAGRVTPNPAPVIIRLHGGGLIACSCLYPAFFAPWLLELAMAKSAIIVSADYRLLPEAGSVGAVVSDIVDDLFPWVVGRDGGLSSFVAHETDRGVSVDVDRILLAGDSAGGYLALMLALARPAEIRGVVAAYPMFDLASDHFVKGAKGSLMGMPIVSRQVFDDHMAAMRGAAATADRQEAAAAPGGEGEGEGGAMAGGQEVAVVSADPLGQRLPLMLSVIQHGLLRDYISVEKERGLFPLLVVEDGAKFPSGGVVIIHGKDDSVVPVEGSVKMKELLARKDPHQKFRLVLRDGDHGFDGGASVEDAWLKKALVDVVESWIA